MEYKGLTLDKFQEDAIESIRNNHSVVVSAPTGSGKTLIADYIIDNDLHKGIRVIYTAPIKALSNQKYKDFCADYGELMVGILTGDVVKNSNAPILVMTTEVYRNMAIGRDPLLDTVTYVIFDEIHFLNDIERGYIWEESIIFSKPHVRFLCLSATIPNADEFALWIKSINKHDVDVIRHDERNVPLHKYFYDAQLGICSLEDIRDIADIPDYDRTMRTRQKHARFALPNHIELVKKIRDKLPCFFFTFSRANCQRFAGELAKEKLFPLNTQVSAIIREKLSTVSPEINDLQSTKVLRKVLPFGIGFHHAGLLPVMKELVEELFSKGLIKVLYATETFAVGINMPAKTVCFASLRKFNGVNHTILNSKEYFQIAGRAGRRGIDKEGFVYAMVDRRDFDYNKLKKATGADIDPILSQFKLSTNTVLNLIKRHKDDEIYQILCKNFGTFQKHGMNFDKMEKNVVFNAFNNIKKKLNKLGYIKDGRLTEKGEFSSKIYADEILFGEIFATEFYKDLNEYQILLLLGCICFEQRERTEIYQVYYSEFSEGLMKKVKENEFLKKEKKFNFMKKISAFVDPCYSGKSIFDIIKNSNLLEGDVIRFLRQMSDRLNQLKKATDDERLARLLESCQERVENTMKDIGGL
ncbi:MAG: DEAD/DEAH box helicase [Nanoarchaeota archaeon]|nr:DEAD/DEAH box helicase [Nanoarchaeota archaeon]